MVGGAFGEPDQLARASLAAGQEGSTQAAGTRTANKRGEGSRLRTEIVQAAVRLLGREELRNAVTLRAIAREAGVAAPSIYPHFADCDAVLDEVVRTPANLASPPHPYVDGLAAFGLLKKRCGA